MIRSTFRGGEEREKKVMRRKGLARRLGLFKKKVGRCGIVADVWSVLGWCPVSNFVMINQSTKKTLTTGRRNRKLVDLTMQRQSVCWYA